MADSRATKRLMDALERDGVLLVHDATLPSATNILVGEPVAGSWWSHPQANEIFNAMQPLDYVATRVKLVAQKVTFVHQRLWPELIAVGSSKMSWQTNGLSDAATTTFARLARRRAPVRVEQLLPEADAKLRQRVVRDLEVRLLVHTDDVHTESGAHAKYVQTWRAFQRSHELATEPPTPSTAQLVFERIVADWPEPTKGRPLLPWMGGSKSRNRR
jgi:hypothetical protein